MNFITSVVWSIGMLSYIALINNSLFENRFNETGEVFILMGAIGAAAVIIVTLRSAYLFNNACPSDPNETDIGIAKEALDKDNFWFTTETIMCYCACIIGIMNYHNKIYPLMLAYAIIVTIFVKIKAMEIKAHSPSLFKGEINEQPND